MEFSIFKIVSKIKYVLAFVLIASILVGSLGGLVNAATTSDRLKETRKELGNLENQKDQAQSTADSLKAEANALEGDLKILNDNLQWVSDDITNIEIQISEKQVEIQDATARLEEATLVKEEQYQDMKLRIKYMYEHSDSDFLTMFLKSKSMSDFLNAVEYIHSISDYDRKQLDEYKETCDKIDNEKDFLETEMTELAALEESKQAKKEELDALVAETQAKYEDKKYAAQSAQNKVDDYNAKIKEMEKLEDELEKKKEEEDKKKKEQLKNPGGTPGTQPPSGSDAAMLAAIIFCEAGGEPYEGMVAVGSVVMNRVASPSYPGTISGVIYQGGQFSPVASGRFAVVLGQGLASQACINAANSVLAGTRNVTACNFRRASSGIPGTIIGNHVFF